MTKFKQILSEHKVAIILAIAISIITAFPTIYFRIDQKEIYQGVELMNNSPWVPRVREVQDGHLNWGSIYYKEGKDLPYLFQPFGSMIVAYMGAIFSLDIGNTILLSFIVLSPIVFLLFYGFVYLLSQNRLIALSSSATILFAGPILSFWGLKRLFSGLSPKSFLELASPVNPAMIYIPVFLFLISFWIFYRKKSWKWGVLSAVFLSLNFYNYFYSWTYLYAFGGILILVYIIRRNWQEAARLGYVFLGALLLAVPYMINLYNSTLHPVYEAASMRAGVVETHAPLFVGYVVIVGILVFLLGFSKEDREKYYFGLALLLAPFVTMSQQVITGKEMQAAHYHWYFHKPMAVIFVIWVIFNLISRFGKESYKKILTASIIAVGLYVAIFTQLASYRYDHNDGLTPSIGEQKYGPAMKWLTQFAPKEAVVFANDKGSDLTVIYTPLNVFHHFKGPLSLAASEERVRDALFTYYRLEGVGEEEASELFHNQERVRISTIMYGMYYKPKLGSYEAIPDDKINEFTALYEETFSLPTAQWLRDMWKKYEVEYLVWDKSTNPSWQLDRFNYLDEASEFGNIIIYKFNP